jgi:putative transposase
VYLFVHVIWSVDRREPLLSKPVRRVLFAHMQKDGEEKGLKIVAVGGVEDHVHCLVQLMPSQNLVQVVKSIRTASAHWLNETRLLSGARPAADSGHAGSVVDSGSAGPVAADARFEWEEGYAAYSVSPSGVKQVIEYIGKQEEYHQSKTLESELEIVTRFSGRQGSNEL